MYIHKYLLHEDKAISDPWKDHVKKRKFKKDLAVGSSFELDTKIYQFKLYNDIYDSNGDTSCVKKLRYYR
jgi:hypothetical protein